MVQWISATARGCSAASTSSQSNQGATPTSADLLDLAKAVRNTATPPEIPLDRLFLLRDVIESRQSCYQWYISQRDPELDTPNRMHKHFIDVLKEVYGILKEVHKRQIDETTGQGSTDSTIDTGFSDGPGSLVNRFDHLDLEDVSENDSEDTTATAISFSAVRADEGVSTEDQAKADRRFALWCFLEDLHRIRQHIERVWARYQQGHLSFLIASYVTNVSFGMMQRLSAEFDTI